MTDEAVFYLSLRLLVMGLMIYLSVRSATRDSNERARQAEMQCEYYEKQLRQQRPVIDAAWKFLKRTEEITEKHPAYGFVVMGIPLMKALAALDEPSGRKDAS